MRNLAIGTRSESSLHRTLKFRYATSGKTEVLVEGFIADGVGTDGEYIEVQIGSFGPLKKKMASFAALGKVKIIHPIIIKKYIEKYSEEGTCISRRKSNRQGSEWDLFKSMLYAPELAMLPGLSIELAIVDVVEKRICDGKGSWRRKGISLLDKELSAWHGCLRLESPADYRHFVPFRKKEKFTVSMLAQKADIDPTLAGKTLYVLNKLGVVKKIGKKKTQAWVYVLNL